MLLECRKKVLAQSLWFQIYRVALRALVFSIPILTHERIGCFQLGYFCFPEGFNSISMKDNNITKKKRKKTPQTQNPSFFFHKTNKQLKFHVYLGMQKLKTYVNICQLHALGITSSYSLSQLNHSEHLSLFL